MTRILKYFSCAAIFLMFVSPVFAQTAPADDSQSAMTFDQNNVVSILVASSDNTGAMADNAVSDILASFKDDSKDEIIRSITGIRADIKNKTNSLQDQSKVIGLKEFFARLRARTIITYPELADRLDNSPTLPRIYKLRWGNLDATRQRCTGISLSDLRDSLSKNVIPAICQSGKKINYSGAISVNKGNLEILDKILFESSDSVTDPSGTSVSFVSDIYNDWDGLVIAYTPPAKDSNDDPLLISVKLGQLNKTFSAENILGVNLIGNDQSLEVKDLAGFVPGLSRGDQDKLTKSHLSIQDAIAVFLNKLDKIRILKQVGASADSLEQAMDEAGSYNFDIQTSGEVESQINSAADNLSLDTASSDLDVMAPILAGKIRSLKSKSEDIKFNTNIIPFKDTDDDQWYADYVAAVKNIGIISGYKDASGNELGEFRPANNITVAEMLKIALETSGQGESLIAPKLASALTHWAKGYVARAEQLGLNIMGSEVDLDRPATRAEVVRTMLEAFGIKPDPVSSTDFSDVIVTVPNDTGDTAYIEYAKKIGIVSGDLGKTTFRPNDPINRAEVAKITSQIINILLGGSDTFFQPVQ